MNNKQQLPKSLQDKIDDFFLNEISAENIDKVFYGLTINALRGIDSIPGQDAADTYFRLECIKELLVELKNYAQ